MLVAIREHLGRFGRFTDQARSACIAARALASRQGQMSVGAEHLLLALCEAPWGMAADLLGRMGVSLEAIRDDPAFARVSNLSMKQECRGRRRWSPEADAALDRAVAEARSLGVDYVGTEHLLLGLAGEGSGTAARLLASLGVGRAEILAAHAELIVRTRPASWLARVRRWLSR